MQFSQGGQCTAEAAVSIEFKATKVILNQGQALIQGYFINSGDTGAYVKKFYLQKLTTDYYGAWDIEFYPENLYVGGGDSVLHTFSISDEKCPQVGQVNSIVRAVVYW